MGMERVAASEEGPPQHFPPQDALLAPLGDAMDVDPRTRAASTYACADSSRFTGVHQINSQFCQLYYQRLVSVMPRVRAAAEARWPGVQVCKVLELQDGQPCVVIGTLYKDMKLKPSVLDEYVKDLSMPRAVISSSKFVADDDSLVLEDEAARVKLVGTALDPANLVTGIIVACRGISEGGDFQVEDMCFAQSPQQGPLPPGCRVSVGAGSSTVPSSSPDDKYVALLSGLNVGDPHNKGLTLQLALDWLTGNLAGGAERDLASRVVRCIVAGNLVSVMDAPTGNVSAKDAHKLTGALREVDAFLCQLASALPVDVMPGRDDPSSVALPQHPLHRCLLPESSRYETTLHRVSNPHECDIDAIRFLGTSGQNVDDLWRCCATDDRLGLLEASLKWGHMVPTAPDTLSCHPFHDHDPFVITSQPHVYFAGNQPGYGTALVQAPCGGGATATTRLVLLPAFSATGTLVLVNLRTLACHPVTFSGAT